MHEVYRSWRKILDDYQPPRIAVAEAGVSAARLPLYTRPDELHQAFNFFHLRCPWDASAFRDVIASSLAGARQVGALPTWVLSNHDVVRHLTRYALPQGTDLRAWLATDGREPPVHGEQGRRRARAAALLTLALPGTSYLYQGEELGLPEVADLPGRSLRDPMWERTAHRVKGRDGCRVPLPWSVTGPSHGFGPGPGWLPAPEGWGAYAVEAQRGHPGSFLELYRRALAVRRRYRGSEEFAWLPGQEGELAFRKGAGLVCRVNLSDRPLPLSGGRLLIASGPLAGGISDGPRDVPSLSEGRALTPGESLPPDTAVWLDASEPRHEPHARTHGFARLRARPGTTPEGSPRTAW